MIGYVQQSFLLTFYIFSAGVVLALVVCLPDYPFYNTHPLAWQQPVKAVESQGEVVTGEEVVGAGDDSVAAEEQQQEEEVVVVKKKKGSKKAAAGGTSSDRKQ